MNGNGTEKYDSYEKKGSQDTAPLGCIVFILSVIVAIGFVIWQIYNWAKTGVWIHLPLSTAFRHYGYDLDLIYNPQNWVGVAKIAQWLLKIPITLCILILGGGMSYFLLTLINENKKPN